MRSEEAFYFLSQGRRLFGFLHGPERPSTGVPVSVLVCHPFGEEKQITHRRLVECARELAERGIRVLRFDLYGHGDSEGEPDEVDFAYWLEDVASAVRWLRERYPREAVGALGLRLGASLVAQFAEDHLEDLDFLVLWSPVVNGHVFLDRLLRQRQLSGIRRQVQGGEKSEDSHGTLVAGWPLSPSQERQIQDLNLNCGKRFAKPVLVVHFSRNRADREQISALAASYAGIHGSEMATVNDRMIWLPIGVWEYGEYASELNNQTRNWIEKTAGLSNG
jgi:exosortase A-associated hydrolase 2